MSLLLQIFKQADLSEKLNPLSQPSIIVQRQNRSCGDICKVAIQRDPFDFRVESSGCAVHVASSEIVRQLCRSRTKAEAHQVAQWVIGSLEKSVMFPKKESKAFLTSPYTSNISTQSDVQDANSERIISEIDHSGINHSNIDESNIDESNINHSNINHSTIKPTSDNFGELKKSILADSRYLALMEFKDHPVRKKCALLAWQTLCEALESLEQ